MSVSEQPLVSVLMPVFNGEKYIREAIDSILNQTFTDFELVIVNDGSTDQSVAIIESYADPRIKLYHNDKNRGLSYTRNKCIECSRGEFLAWLDCDDIALPTRLEEQIDFLTSNPSFGLIGSGILLIDEAGNACGSQEYPSIPEMIPSILLFHNYFAQSAVMLRKSILPPNAYRQEFPPAEDYDLWIRIARQHKVWNLPKMLVRYRLHTQSISHTPEFTLAAEKKILRWQLQELGINADEQEFNTYFSICKREIKMEEKYLIHLKKCLEKLKMANANKTIYEEPYFSKSLEWFDKLLYQYQYQQFVKRKSINMVLLLQFYLSPLKHYKTVGKPRQLRFILKKIIKNFT